MGAYFQGKKVAGDLVGDWVDVQSYLASGFTTDSFVKFRLNKSRKEVQLIGSLKTTKDIAYSSDAIPIFTKLPFALSGGQYMMQHGSGNATWLLGVTTGSVLGMSRYAVGGTNATAQSGVWLTLGGTWAID
ncbi:hypothetical protein [Lacticaseibacillus hulanensis]|uniref:hypothetical protein n=1 Tax=Lacticaseibacillus hulanensis TaxID=2493111 RepID=UPI000FDA6A68|nr:hypothetical protein [Lacticaseibacillus hulanensis]